MRIDQLNSVATVLLLTERMLYVFCPRCFSIHSHGMAKTHNPEGDYFETRSPHCHAILSEHKRIREYHLVANEETLRLKGQHMYSIPEAMRILKRAGRLTNLSVKGMRPVGQRQPARPWEAYTEEQRDLLGITGLMRKVGTTEADPEGCAARD